MHGACPTFTALSCSRVVVQVTDAANEAKDNVKYLATLEKSLEPMFNGTVQDITDTIPALISNIRMMYTIARYYSTPGAWGLHMGSRVRPRQTHAPACLLCYKHKKMLQHIRDRPTHISPVREQAKSWTCTLGSGPGVCKAQGPVN